MKILAKMLLAMALLALCFPGSPQAVDSPAATGTADGGLASVATGDIPLSAPHLTIGVPATVAREVFGGGGTNASSRNFRLQATVGEAVVGTAAAPSLTLSQGFWQDFGGSCCLVRADINHDGRGPDISDLIYFVSYVFQGGPNPICGSELDVNGDGRPIPDISDIVYLVSYMFGGGAAPLPCAG